MFEAIFAEIGTLNKFFVDIGCRDPELPESYSNTYYLRTEYGFEGLLLDRDTNQTHYLVTHEEVTPDNVIDIFRRYGVPKEFDLLDIDIDSYDYWVWESICNAGYRPRVVCIEFDTNLPYYPAFGVISSGNRVYPEGVDAMSNVSLSALYQLGIAQGYELLNAVRHNGIFILAELSGPFKTYTLGTLINMKHKCCRCINVDAENRQFTSWQVTAPIGRLSIELQAEKEKCR